MLNGFPQTYLLKENSHSYQSDEPETKSVAFIVLLYVCEISEKIKQLLNELNKKFALKPLYTIANFNFVPSPKDSVKKDELSGLVYQVSCADCNLIYIGQTKQSLKSRLTEHQRCIKYQRLDQSVLCEHSMIVDHKIEWKTVILKLKLTKIKDYL